MLRGLHLLLVSTCVAITCGVGSEVARSASTEDQAQRDLYIQRALQPPADAALVGHKPRSTGTGFFVAERSLLTNDHVVRDCGMVSVRSGDDETEATGAVIATDSVHDLALVKTSVSGPGIAEIETRTQRADGSDLYIVGFPAHGLAVRQATLTPAMAKPSSLAAPDPAFQIAASVHPGHSGSPVLDEYGAVIGVVRGAVNTPSLYAKTGQVVTDIGLAISDRELLEFLRAQKVPYRPAASTASLSPAERLERARAFVYQVICSR